MVPEPTVAILNALKKMFYVRQIQAKRWIQIIPRAGQKLDACACFQFAAAPVIKQNGDQKQPASTLQKLSIRAWLSL